jgi:hypothetical protein
LEPIDFSEKKPKTSATSSRSGLSVTFSGQRSTLYIKKPELRKYDLLNPGFLVQNRYLCQPAKDPAIFYFFLDFAGSIVIRLSQNISEQST